jgi:hypothetical protein
MKCSKEDCLYDGHYSRRKAIVINLGESAIQISVEVVMMVRAADVLVEWSKRELPTPNSFMQSITRTLSSWFYQNWFNPFNYRVNGLQHLLHYVMRTDGS